MSDVDELNLVISAVDLIKAQTFAETQEALESLLDSAKWVAREKFANLASVRVQGVKSDLHDEAIQAQGGL